MLSNRIISAAAMALGLAAGMVSPASGAATRAYDATISPGSVAAGSTTSPFTIVLTNDPSTSKNQDIRSATVMVPAGFIVDGSSLSVSASGGKSWGATLSGSTIILGATQGNDGIAAGESLTLTFNATAPCTDSTYTWTTAAYQDTLNTNGSVNTGTPYTLVGSQPTVSVTGQCQQQQLSGYCTVSQGGWGAPPHGNNPGELLASDFPSVYPSGVQVGTPNWMKFTSASAVKGYLPAGGTPSTLSTTYTDPTSTSAGVFGGQVLSLRLNENFQSLFPGASHSITGLVLTGTGTSLDGSTVSAIESAAETALGGGSLPVGFSISGLNTLIDLLNNAFDDCTTSSWANAHLVAGP